jgi:tetratricopeptide (TPR) repeat protein
MVMKKSFLILLLVLSCGLFMGVKVIEDKVPRENIPGASLIYIPSGKYLKHATFGYSSLMADLIYIWAIQYYTDYTIPERYEHLDHVFSIIAELDPLYLDPYEVGAIIAVYDARDPYLACKILDRGLEKNPDQWIFPYQAGHYAAIYLKDYNLAREYYKKTMAIPGAPAIAKRLYADAAFKVTDYRTAWENWLEVYETAEDDRIKKIASNHLYQVRSAVDMALLTEAIEKYKKSTGRFPKDLDQLVSSGILAAIPKDLDEREYIYDPETGKVDPPLKWWKR